MKLITALIIIFGLTACSTVERVVQEVNEHDLAIRLATAEFIDSEAEVAMEVVAFTEEALLKLEGAVTVELAALQAEADRMIPWASMSPGQRILAQELLAKVERRIVTLDPSVVDSRGLDDLRGILAKIQGAAKSELRYLRAA